MYWQYLTPFVIVVVLGILFFVWCKSILNDRGDTVSIFFFVCNAQDYFEGLVWDLRRISNWRGKDVVIYVTDVGSNDDTLHIIKLLEDKGFLNQLTPRQAAKFLRNKSKREADSWIFNLKEDTDIKEIRKCFVRIFTETIKPTQRKTDLFEEEKS